MVLINSLKSSQSDPYLKSEPPTYTWNVFD